MYIRENPFNLVLGLAQSPPTLLSCRPLSPVTHVIQEMVTTEQSYVRDLSAIIEVSSLLTVL